MKPWSDERVFSLTELEENLGWSWVCTWASCGPFARHIENIVHDYLFLRFPSAVYFLPESGRHLYHIHSVCVPSPTPSGPCLPLSLPCSLPSHLSLS